MVFHEITKDAIQKAQENTRELDTALVDAQETRRILDRLYGYEVSPVLWRKVGPGLSAGRVQSAATRLVVDRERERLAFVSASYWDLAAIFSPTAERSPFPSRLVRVNGSRISSGRDFDDRGNLKGEATTLDAETAQALAEALYRPDVTAVVQSVESKPYTRRPAAPFTTSTLQQEAARKLRFSARQTMSVAQSLYENGYITYMRTDSPNLSQQAIDAARSQAKSLYGSRHRARQAARCTAARARTRRRRTRRSAPRATPSRRRPSSSRTLRGNDWKLYDLIWKRTVASQMADAKGSTASVVVAATTAQPVTGITPGATAGGTIAEFVATGTVITFRGFLSAYEEGQDEDRHAADAAPADAKLPVAHRGPGPGRRRRRGQGARHQRSSALHRGQPGQDARRARHRPPLDLRRDHVDHRRPRLRHSARHGARAELDRLLGGPAARGVLRRPRRVRLHRQHGGRPRPHRRRRGRPGRLAERLLLRQRDAPRPPQGDRQPRRDRRARHQLDPSRRGTSLCASAGTAPTSRPPATTRRPRVASTCPKTSPPTSSRRRRLASSWTRRSIGDRVLGVNPDSRQGGRRRKTAASARTSPSARPRSSPRSRSMPRPARSSSGCGRRRDGCRRCCAAPPPPQSGTTLTKAPPKKAAARPPRRAAALEGAHRLPLQVDDRRRGRPRDRAETARPAPHGRHRPRVGRGDPGSERSLRPVPEEGRRHPLADRAKIRSSRSTFPARSSSTRSPSTARGERRVPSRSSRRPTPSAARRSRSRTAASVRTSPTARRTRRFRAARPSKTSTSIAPCS